jgi:hypothetical protein
LIDARDRSLEGKGNMRVISPDLRLADVRGREMDEASLQRLGEMVWFPIALLDARYVRWTPVDDTRARATLRVRGHEGAATFHFDANGCLPHHGGSVSRRGRQAGAHPVGRRVQRVPRHGGLRCRSGLRRWHVNGRDEPYARFTVEARARSAETYAGPRLLMVAARRTVHLALVPDRKPGPKRNPVRIRGAPKR